jgi:c-di-GMP-binding flagellar brake protein YcgR
MQPNMERRKDPRTEIGLTFKGITKNSFKDFTIEDISKGGLKLAVLDKESNKLKTNNNLRISVYYKINSLYGEEGFNITSTVKWIKQEKKSQKNKINFLGVEFKNRDDTLNQKLNTFLTTFKKNDITKIDCIVE